MWHIVSARLDDFGEELINECIVDDSQEIHRGFFDGKSLSWTHFHHTCITVARMHDNRTDAGNHVLVNQRLQRRHHAHGVQGGIIELCTAECIIIIVEERTHRVRILTSTNVSEHAPEDPGDLWMLFAQITQSSENSVLHRTFVLSRCCEVFIADRVKWLFERLCDSFECATQLPDRLKVCHEAGVSCVFLGDFHQMNELGSILSDVGVSRGIPEAVSWNDLSAIETGSAKGRGFDGVGWGQGGGHGYWGVWVM